ncbi:MAG: hypothetical protein KKG47_00740 [Proteobacteria bacterium]|nr:hypothetical protein [Pseudomonadota bacterium]MBU1737266.1 hypothetical protein [Pseudomonadota bacterium]
MNMLEALFFPGTIIPGNLPGKISWLVDRLSYYQVIENEITPEGGFPDGCHPYTPVPLGPEKNLFVRMLADLKANQADYYGGLLSFISTAARYDVDESSVWSLVSRLHRGDARKEGGRKAADRLWQARLILKLAEILADEEREVGLVLNDVRRKERELFVALHGDEAGVEDSDDDLIPAPAAPTAGRHLNEHVLLAAWGCLHALDPAESSFLVTDNDGCAGLLLDLWERKMGREPERLFEAGLPERAGAEGDPCQAEARKKLQQALAAIAGGRSTAGVHDVWEAHGKDLACDGPAGSSSMEVFLLEGGSVPDLFGQISGVKPVRTSDRCLVGIIRSRLG